MKDWLAESGINLLVGTQLTNDKGKNFGSKKPIKSAEAGQYTAQIPESVIISGGTTSKTQLDVSSFAYYWPFLFANMSSQMSQ